MSSENMLQVSIGSLGSPLLIGGLVIGVLFSVVLERSRFCMVGALSDFVIMRDTRHVHAWLAALAVAIAGTAWLEASGQPTARRISSSRHGR